MRGDLRTRRLLALKCIIAVNGKTGAFTRAYNATYNTTTVLVHCVCVLHTYALRRPEIHNSHSTAAAAAATGSGYG